MTSSLHTQQEATTVRRQHSVFPNFDLTLSMLEKLNELILRIVQVKIILIIIDIECLRGFLRVRKQFVIVEFKISF